ncbi:cytochrome P450 [Mycena leptocephala]|nr:cytochrome P450 [Mycena leptocephala]
MMVSSPGNMLQLLLPPQHGDYEYAWMKMYGSIYRVKGCLGRDRLMVSDPVAIQYLFNSSHFQTAPLLWNVREVVFGKGNMSCLKGESHKRIRAVFNSSFTTSSLCDYEPIFERVAREMSQQLEASDTQIIDICSVFGLATFDAISDAVLGRSAEQFGDRILKQNLQIVGLVNTQSQAAILLEACLMRLPTQILRTVINFPRPAISTVKKSRDNILKLGKALMQERQDALTQGLETNSDALSNLIRSNKAMSILIRQEVAQQIPILWIAGQNTTANTLTFTLLELARQPSLQQELRAKIHGHVTLKLRGYDDMALLNAVIKEALRMYPATPFTDYVAARDTIVPITGGVRTSTGEILTEISVRQGQTVTAALGSYQRVESRWGSDPHEFRPSRWLDGSVQKGEAFGPYANLLVMPLIIFRYIVTTF